MPAKTKTISRTEILAILEPWYKHYQHYDSHTEQLITFFGMDTECEFSRRHTDLLCAYTRQIEQRLDDRDGWLSWYLWDNDGGKNALPVCFHGWKRPLKIRTLAHLARILHHLQSA
jgi:hypothetical protein